MKKILMLGGAHSQIPAIKRAKELGFYAITCDYLPDNPGHKISDEYQNISTVEMDRVLEYAEGAKIDGIIAYASDPSAVTGAYVCDKLSLPGSSYDSVQMLSHKDMFRHFQRQHHFNTPDFITVTSLKDLENIGGNIKLPCMVKPVDSSGSKGVFKVTASEELKTAFLQALSYSRCKRVIIEEYISSPYFQLHGDGVVADGKLEFIALGDQRFLNSVPIGTSLPSRLDNDLLEKVNAEVARLIESSKFTCGGINVEVRVKETGEIYIIEIGPRTGGNYVPQLMQLATGADEVTAVLQLAMGMPCDIRMPEKTKCCLQYIIGSTKSGRFQNLQIDRYMQDKIVELFMHKKPGDFVDSYENSSGVVAVALIKFSDMREMENDIRNIERHIQVITIQEDAL